MRGNPLKSLTEATFSSQQQQQQQQQPAADRAVNLLEGPFDQSGGGGDFSLANNISRLYESYPILARSLLLSQKRRTNSGTENDHGSFIIEQMELELLESIVRQNDDNVDVDEEISDSEDSGADIADDDGNVDDQNGRPDDDLGAANELNQAGSSGGGGAKRRPPAGWRVKRKKVSGATGGLGGHFSQLQELDFGQCQLTYIKWSVFDQLDQLKRLHLDGNRLR